MAFPADFIERLKSANPIAEVMGEHVSMKRSGRDYVCLCPFHNEKTPSCYIHPDRDFFHCFGCGAGGDVITFTMKYNNLEYLEAVKLLAERANIEMPADSYGRQQSGTIEKRKRLYEINRDAAKFFYRQLSTPEGRVCVSYLMKTRGLKPETIKRYGMGFAPNSWSALKTHMMGLGYTEQELLDARLISSSKNNTKHTFDFFVNRAMFPFIDLTGHILGFGGRTLGDDKRKYINSPDSLIYNKAKFLFSMNFAKNAAVKERKILLCEGNLDVVSLNEAGFENAVASCGTALTPEQAKLISTYADEAVICYDSDEAGQKATQRAITILSQAGLKTTVLQMKGAKDPDEYIRKFGAAAFGVLISGADGAVDYKLKMAAAQSDMNTDTGKLAFKDAAVKIISALPSAVERDIYGHKAAEQIGVSFNVFDAEVNSAISRRRRFDKKQERQRELRFEDRRDSVNTEKRAHFAEATAEEYIISYLYANPDYLPRLEQLTPDKFVTQFNRRVYEYITERMKNGEDRSTGQMNEVFSGDEMSRIFTILQRARDEGIDMEAADDCVQLLLNYKPPKKGAEMTDDELAAYIKEQKHK